jgi:hypothetical protein
VRRVAQWVGRQYLAIPGVVSLAFSCWIHFKLGDFALAAEDVLKLRETVGACGLHALHALGRTLGGIVEASQAEDPKDGLSETMAGLGEWQAGGLRLLACYFYAEAASIWLRSDDARHAEIELRKAFAIAENTGEGYYLAEMHRLRGEIAALRTKDQTTAETDFIQAMNIAKAQGSPTFQLRATISLLRFSRTREDLAAVVKTRRIARCRNLLALLCHSLDGRSDCADLHAARSVLAESDGPGRARRGTTKR